MFICYNVYLCFESQDSPPSVQTQGEVFKMLKLKFGLLCFPFQFLIELNC